eukprot:CAMPEP_0114363980 /NCGR_PEP_ID=MMETSP0101-20121206/27098_1 /TAXON_ID=38822 ORGANISM="Pteridomonas danica, Strain PT" /NCGR_SAMPLE_ID=MMETSP0101 /ASSEMBLY_ACC=CAM_ASM_000211 /LENGTH=86 /DNA_ID=CAMNT_0001511143 /DNA_START=123 /DNA_END=380 /DNA_ORIENTATION=-
MCSLFIVGVGFGSLPAISAQIANEAHADQQGQVNGFNYAVSTLAWAVSPYAYWAMYEAYVDDDAYENDNSNDVTHVNNIPSSLIWW